MIFKAIKVFEPTTRRIAAVLLGSTLTVLTPSAQTVAPTPMGPDAMGITSDELMQHIRYLADDAFEGRGSGEKGAALAAKYVALEFEKYGLQPAGQSQSWFQEFEIALGSKIGPATRLVSRAKGEARTHSASVDFLPFDNVERQSATGAVVFAGYGIIAPEHQYDDYAAIDVRDKIVLVLRREPQANDPKSVFQGTNHTAHAEFRTKLKVAQERGAKALLIADAAPNRQSISQMASGGPFRFGLRAQSIPMIFVDYNLAAGWLQSANHDLAKLVADIDIDLKPRSFALDNLIELNVELLSQKATARNVLGLLPGADAMLKDEIVLLGAHFDHVGYGLPPGTNRTASAIHNGADDNASGTAALLELAEAFARAEVRPRRSLLFIGFDAEERGLLGSQHYVEHPLHSLSNILAMINLDQVGRGKNGLNIGGIGTSPGFKGMVDQLKQNSPLNITTSQGGRGPSDHASFYNQNIPVLFFHTGLHPQYHKPTDDWPLIHTTEIEQVTRLAWLFVDHLANADTGPSFTKADGVPFRRSRRDRGVQLGVQFDPEFGGDGVKVTQVSANSVAERAGVKPQDVIVRINEETISNYDQLISIIGRLNRSASAELVVMRDNHAHSLTVKFGAPAENP